jgi:tRNA U34 5-methylaminomethyl-2-thiouridine-forming methyltransferase MnmC
LKKEIIITKDGSTSLYIPELNETYHSKHGAIQEAKHVFIKNGLDAFNNNCSVLEIGFGTGLNAFITFLEAEKRDIAINYVGVEAYPVSIEEAMKMNYVEELNAENYLSIFQTMHQCKWEEKIHLSSKFSLTKQNQKFQDIINENSYDLIYFDAFGFSVQPELWSEIIFKKMYNALKADGVLVTYACRTVIKAAMIQAGFTIEKLAGAPGKREMLRGKK